MFKYGILIFICIVFLPACATVPITNRRQLSFISSDSLLNLSDTGYRRLLAESKVSQDVPKVQMVRNVGRKIADAAEQFMREEGMEKELRNYKWEFNLFEDDKVINAFCMYGGKIGIYTGILAVTQDENGLAVVMAHEVAHSMANHNGERMSQLLLMQVSESSLGSALKGKSEKTQQLWRTLYGMGSSLGIMLPYSRIQESEADYIGLIIMARAGYDPKEAIPFWERMDKQGGSKPPEFLSTHPIPKRRIEDIRKALPEVMKHYAIY